MSKAKRRSSFCGLTRCRTGGVDHHTQPHVGSQMIVHAGPQIQTLLYAQKITGAPGLYRTMGQILPSNTADVSFTWIQQGKVHRGTSCRNPS